MLRKILATLVLSGLAAGCAGTAPSTRPEQMQMVESGIVLDHVTVVDTRTGALSRDRAVIIRDDRIASIVPAGQVSTSGTARRIDATGKFVVPGYLDMHAHPLEPANPAFSLPLMVSYGVTGYRQMGGSPTLLAARRAGKLPQGIVPELLATPGMVLAGPMVATPEGARAAVREQKAQGADFIKAVDMPPPAYFAAIDEAHKLGMELVGHLPPTIDVRVAARDMHSIEHLGPNVSILEACTPNEEAIRGIFQNIPTNGAKIAFDLPREQLERLTANPMLIGGPRSVAVFGRIIDQYDVAKCQELAKTLAATNSWQVPTLIREKSMQFGNAPLFRDDPRLRYVPANTRALWRDVGADFDKQFSPEDRATLARLFERDMALVKLFDEAGVKMLAGSDMGGVWLIPGVSLHQEFDLLAQAGLSPLRVLQMTTLNGAQFLGREDRMGTVEPGKLADLVLLDANPLESVENLHAIYAVVLKGRYRDKKELDSIREGLAEKAR